MSSAIAAFLGLLEYKLLVGLLVAVVGGFIVVWALVSYLRHHTGEKWEEPRVRVPAWLTGVIAAFSRSSSLIRSMISAR